MKGPLHPRVFKCVHCLTPSKTLYISYCASAVKLSICNHCQRVVDPYTERETLLIGMDLILWREQAYRHVIYNKRIAGTKYPLLLGRIALARLLHVSLLLQQQQQEHHHEVNYTTPELARQSVSEFILLFLGSSIIFYRYKQRVKLRDWMDCLVVPSLMGYALIWILYTVWEPSLVVHLMGALWTISLQYMCLETVLQERIPAGVALFLGRLLVLVYGIADERDPLNAAAKVLL